MNKQQFTLINRLSEIVDNTPSSEEEVKKITKTLAKINKFKRALDTNLSTKILYDKIGNMLKTEFDIENYQVVITKKTKETLLHKHGNASKMNYHFTRKVSDDVTVHIYIEKMQLNGFDKMTLNSYFEEIVHLLYMQLVLTELKKTTTTDPLTNLRNRLSFNQEMKSLIPLALREKMKIGLLLINIDRFRAVNDEHGNDFGDEFLKLYADTLQKLIRSSDIAVRFGGGEFLVLLINVESEEKTISIAHKIKDTLAKTYLLSPNGDHFKKTVTIGLSMFPDDSLDIEEIINNANIALTDAQAIGRNTILRYIPSEKSTIDLF